MPFADNAPVFSAAIAACLLCFSSWCPQGQWELRRWTWDEPHDHLFLGTRELRNLRAKALKESRCQLPQVQMGLPYAWSGPLLWIRAHLVWTPNSLCLYLSMALGVSLCFLPCRSVYLESASKTLSICRVSVVTILNKGHSASLWPLDRHSCPNNAKRYSANFSHPLGHWDLLLGYRFFSWNILASFSYCHSPAQHTIVQFSEPTFLAGFPICC